MKGKQIFGVILALYFMMGGRAFSEENGGETMAPPIVSEIIVEIDGVRGDKTEWIEITRNLIFLRQGEPFSPKRFQESLDALKLCKKFQNIHVDSSDGEEEITITFRMTPFRLIEDIQIDDASPLFERDILNVMTTYIGDAFVREELSKQEKLIETVFRNEGFVNPKVKVTAKEDPADGHFTIYVNIDRGDYYSVKQVNISGNKSFSSKRLQLRMKMWTASLLPSGAGRFIEKNLKEDVKDLTEFYRKKRYPDVVIDSKTEKMSETDDVHVSVIIDEGMRYDVEFDGNEEFWDLTLEDDLIIFKEGNKNDFGIKKSVRNIRDRYKNAGYPEIAVKVEDKKDEERAVRTLRLVIDEGPRSIVESIQVTGNVIFDDEKIKKQMLTQPPGTFEDGAFVPEVLEDDINAIKSLYLTQGYMNTQVKKDVKTSEDKRRVSVSLEIDEGIQTIVASVNISGNILSGKDAQESVKVKPETSFQEEAVREDREKLSYKDALEAVKVKPGDPFRDEMIQEDRRKLASIISEKGYPHVQIDGAVTMNEDQSAASVEYKIDEGPPVKMGEIYLTGNFRTKPRILLNEIEIKPNAPFSLVKLLESQRNIRDLDVVDSVQFKAIGLKEKADRIHLFVETEEKKPYFVEVGVGYDTTRNFYANAKSGDLNLFGTNKSAWLSGEISEIGYRGEFGITEPRLYGSRISGTLEIFIEEEERLNQEFGIRAFGSSLGFARKWFKVLTTGLNFRFEQRDQFRHDTGETYVCDVNEDECETRRFLVTTPSVSYDSRDSFIRPKKGGFSSASVDFSQGLENSVDNFLKYQIDAKYYWTPWDRLTFALHSRAGHIEPLGSSEKVADDHLFFLGGTSDVRGFKENMLRFDTSGTSLGGQTSILGSVEARFDLGLNFEFTTFYDIGTLKDTFKETDSEETRSAAGVGLRYITPIGPVGFLYGFKLGRDEEESAGRLHFSLGYTF